MIKNNIMQYGKLAKGVCYFPMITYNDNWEKVPIGLKTKTSLGRLGFEPVDFGPVVAEMVRYDKRYPLYSFDTAVENARKAGRKTAINAITKESTLLMDINTTGWESSDEVIELMLMNFDGVVLFHQWFKPEVEVCLKNKKFLGNPKLADKKPISEYWEEIQRVIAGKTLIIPNKFGVWKMLAQTCAKYDLHLTVETSVIEDHQKIQKCFVSMVSLPEPRSDALLSKNCITLISCLYPNSILFSEQEQAKCYFNMLCNFNIRQGDVNSFSNGYRWIFQTFGERSKDFENYSFNTCNGIIQQIYPALHGLKLI